MDSNGVIRSYEVLSGLRSKTDDGRVVSSTRDSSLNSCCKYPSAKEHDDAYID